MRTATSAAIAALLLLGLAAACGGRPSQPEGSTKVSMTEFAFEPADLTVSSGKVVFYLVNDGSSTHDMAILRPDGSRLAKSEQVGAGSATVFTVSNLPAGQYTIVCTLPGHEDAGMKGTLKAT